MKESAPIVFPVDVDLMWSAAQEVFGRIIPSLRLINRFLSLDRGTVHSVSCTTGIAHDRQFKFG